MSITGAIVLFAVIWFVTLLALLPIGLTTQDEAGDVAPGTPSSAPADAMIGRKLAWTTVVTLVLWSAVCAVILWGGLGVRDIDFWGRM
jgi:predicted secreted protein